ncbi:hypothetical protein BaRGS_00017375 [Batillaria attramentaria]|uniref:IRF tryptophan pentad repeat domain-containing protein n=1 Tax=Batillaria attramentaria TaxID=370345 RepID=A0ABD0KXB0_9CAEN|nr:hypothetical protein BaRGS_019104 [Batillaria attramentaria]
MDQDAMPDSSGSSNKVRQRLKPWLEAKINSGRFPGLTWVNKEQGIFRITWKHGGRADWSEQDALIFKEWAIHTGRYREGTDAPDWPSWKTRLRCALNKLPDIQELRELSCYDEPNPYRVYKFVDRKGSGSSSPPHRDQTLSAEDGTCHSGHPAFQQQGSRPSVIQTPANIPNIITEVDSEQARSLKTELGQGGSYTSEEAKMSSLGSDLENISLRDLVPLDSNTPSLTNISVDSNINSTEPMDTESVGPKHDPGAAYHPGAGWMSQPKPEMWLSHTVKTEPTEKDNRLSQTPPAEHELIITLKFRNQTAGQYTVNNPRGCRVFYGPLQPLEIRQNTEQLWGDPSADQLEIPYTQGQFDLRQDALTMKLLNALDRGFNIYVEGGSIYLLRRCKTMIFAAPPNMDEKMTVKVERTQEPVKIFDFYSHFLPGLQRFKRGDGPRPSAQVVVALGQNFRADIEPYSNLLISLTICHAQASAYLSQHVPECSEPQISRSNEYDQLANFIHYPAPQLYMAETTH